MFVLLAISPSSRADWPHLRGPGFDGLSSERDLADAWPEGGPRRLWSRELGQGYSGFIVGGGKLFTQYQTISGQHLLCLDPDTGETLWENRYDWAWRGAYPGPYASPTWHEGRVFFASTSSIVGCVNAANGEPIWSISLKEKFGGKGFEFGYAATPLVEEGKVILPVGGPKAGLVALDAKDGSTLWTAGSDPASYCPAFPITFQERRCVVGYMQNSLLIVQVNDGKVLHRQALSAGYDEHSAWPIYREPHLALTAPFRVPATRYELAESKDGSLSAKVNWLSKEMSNDVASSVLYEKHLYGFDLRDLQSRAHRASRGTFKCIDWDTGKLCWANEEVGHASLVIADGKLLMLSDTGALILARADPLEYRELGRVQLFDDEICWTPPTLWRGKLFVRSPSRALCVYVGTDVVPAGNVNAAPARRWRIDADLLLTRDREFPNDAPTWQEMTLWFTASVSFMILAALTAWIFAAWTRRSGTAVFLVSAFVLCALGPNVLSALADQLLFTWPTCLYLVLHAAVLVYTWAQDRAGASVANASGSVGVWWARLMVVVLLGVGYAYYEACKLVGMFIAWSFLVGFPFAFPFTFLAARTTSRWAAALWTLLAFAAFFWSAQALLMWKAT